MTMKWSVGGGVLIVVTAVSAVLAAEPAKEPAKGSTPADKKVPTVNCVVASPRAYLAGGAREGAINYAAMTGGAENFARPAKAKVVEVPVGTRVVFALDPETEGVWMQGAHGMIGTLLTVQQLVVKDCAECEGIAATEADDARGSQVSLQGRDSNDVTPPADPNDKTGTRRPAPPVDPNDRTGVRRPVPPVRWVPLATDGVRDTRFGPSIGWAAKVAVPVLFQKPGVYCIRGIITTTVKSWNPRPATKASDRAPAGRTPAATVLPDNLLAVDVDVVHVAVRVVDQPATGKDTGKTADPNQAPAPKTEPVKSADSQVAAYATTMPNIVDVDALDLDAAGLGDLGVFVSEQEGDFVLPTE